MSSSWECTSGGKCEKNRNLQCRLQVKSPKGDQHQLASLLTIPKQNQDWR